MLLGQSLFQSVLTRLTDEGEDEPGDQDREPTGESFRVRGLGTGFVADTAVDAADDDPAMSAAAGAQAYFAFLDDEPDQPTARTEQTTHEKHREPPREEQYRAEPPGASGKIEEQEPAGEQSSARDHAAKTKAPPSPKPGAKQADTLPKASEPPATPPARLLRLTREEIADELGISARDTEASLAEKRRRFAKANHPDRVAPQFRDNANHRMQIANLLIDQAIKRLSWR